MAPFRPNNVNKKAYPGNGSVVGPTRIPSVGFTTTTCCQCYCNVFGTVTETTTLGCCVAAAQCPFCHCCCCCVCETCNRVVPGGMWKSTEQWYARVRDAWGTCTSTNQPAIGFCSPCCGTSCGPGTDWKAFKFCESGGTQYFVAPNSVEVSRSWYSRDDAASCANSTLGSCGWYSPGCGTLNSGCQCRTYWDTFVSTCYRSADRWSPDQFRAWMIDFNGFVGAGCIHSGESFPMRAFRNAPS